MAPSDIEPRPIFVVGAPRSGTTLLRSILDAHPGVCCPTWETGIFDRLAPMYHDLQKDPGQEANIVNVRRKDLICWMRRAVDDLMQTLTAASGKPRWGEKTPGHIFHIELIHAVYPQAQVVHIIRDGRAVVKSLQNMTWTPGKIRWSVDRWRQSVEAGRHAAKSLPKGSYTEVRYEQLTANPEATVAALCNFLGEKFEPVMLQFHRPENNSWGVKQEAVARAPINKGYRSLSIYERVVMKRRAGSLLHDLGYV